MISRASRRRCIPEAEPGQIQFVDEDIDHAYRVVLGHVIINAIGQKQLLPAATALNETSHFGASCNARIIAYQGVSHSLDQSKSFVSRGTNVCS
jgi:hypothetical protein